MLRQCRKLLLCVFATQVVMKFLSALARAALLSFHAFCLWSKTEVMMGGKQWKPQRAWSGTSQMKASLPSSSDTYLPFLHTRTHRNKLPSSWATTRLPETFSQLWSNRQSTKGTHCFTDTHLPLPLSTVRARLPKSRIEIMLILCSWVGIFCRCSLSLSTWFYFICVWRCRQSCIEEPCQTEAFLSYFWCTWR